MTWDPEEAERLACMLSKLSTPPPEQAFLDLAHDAAEQLRAAVEEIERTRNRVLRPLTEGEIKRALHEGRAEAMAATGDNAWTTLLLDRDRLAAGVRELESFVAEACDIAESPDPWSSGRKKQIARIAAIRARLGGRK